MTASAIVEATRLGDFLGAEMEKKGLSAEQLGRAAGISASTVGQIVRGEIVRPPDQRLRGFARALDVSFERLKNMIPEDVRESDGWIYRGESGTEPFQEAHALKVVSPVAAGKPGSEWEVVIIEAGESLNGTFYPADVLRDAVKRGLFEGVKAAAYFLGGKQDHVPGSMLFARPGGFSQNTVGYFDNVKFGRFTDSKGKSGEGVVARFHILPAADWLRENLLAAFKSGNPDLLGFSIDAKGKARDGNINGKALKIVEHIEKVNETTVVSEPAAGGRAIRLVASVSGGGSAGHVMDLLEGFGNVWFDGVEIRRDAETIREHAIRVVEANLGRAEAQLSEVEGNEATTADVARGVGALSKIRALIIAGDFKEAAQILRDWLAVHTTSHEFYTYPKVHTNRGTTMAEATPTAAVTDPTTPAVVDEPTQKLAEKDSEIATLKNQIRIDGKLRESGLHEIAQARVKKILEGRPELTDEQIDEAIAEERKYADEIRKAPATATAESVGDSGGSPQGLGGAYDNAAAAPRVSVGANEEDRWTKAFDAMFEGVPHKDGIPAVSSLHEAFYQATGKSYPPYIMARFLMEALYRGFPHSEVSCVWEDHMQESRARGVKHYTDRFREAVTTGTWSTAFGVSMFKAVQREYTDDPLNDWREIVTPGFINLRDLTNAYSLIRTGGIGVLPVVNEGAPYTELSTPTENTETLTPSKKGGLEKVTWEAMLADDVNQVQQIPRKLGRAAARTIHEAVWDIIETNGVLADAVALIDDATHSNRLVGDGAISYDNVSTLIEQLIKQTEQDSGKRLGLRPWRLLISPDLWQEGFEITDSDRKTGGADDQTTRSFVNGHQVSLMMTVGLGRTAGTINRYFVMANPREASSIKVGFLGGRDRPEIFVQSPTQTPTSGESFDADILTFKIRYGFGVAAEDHRWIQGSLTA